MRVCLTYKRQLQLVDITWLLWIQYIDNIHLDIVEVLLKGVFRTSGA